MKLAGRNNAVFYLSEDGGSFFHQLTGEEPWVYVMADVEDTDDVGVWLRMQRDNESKYLLLRWEYILGVEVSEEKGRIVGLKR